MLGPKKSSMYSSEYTSGFSGPAASHLAPLIRLVTKTMSDRLLPILKAITKNFSKPAAQAAGTSIALYLLRMLKAVEAADERRCEAYDFGT